MKRIAGVLILTLLLTGCGKTEQLLDRAMGLRARLLAGSCSFEAEITADYGDELLTFAVYCEGDNEGDLAFRITEPETIAGITGIMDREGGKLTFRDTALAFPLLADGQISPAGASWIFFYTLRGGYLTSVGMEEEMLRVTIDDSYEEDALTVDIWLNEEDIPVRAEILYDGRRILTLVIRNFQIL